VTDGQRRRIVTGDEVRFLPEGSVLEVQPGTILTDVAREWVERRRIQIVVPEPSAGRPEPVAVALGSDHAGYDMKEAVKGYLGETGSSFIDYGTDSKDPVDYPDFAHRVAVSVALGQARRGIVVDGAGIGSAIVANKVPGIRAAACHDETQARNAREHNDANVLTLGARLLTPESAKKVVGIFLSAEMTEARHRARVAKIEAVEKKYFRPV
jgi:ribose 5-phosphate isomerase B